MPFFKPQIALVSKDERMELNQSFVFLNNLLINKILFHIN